MKLSRYKTNEIIKSTNGKIFSCSFVKKDGSLRKMVARIGVTKNLKGGTSKSNNRNSLITVFDMINRGYRMINLETLINFKSNGIQYQVV